MISEGEIVALAQTLAKIIVKHKIKAEGHKVGEFKRKDMDHRARFMIRTDPWYGQLAKSVIEAVLKHEEAKR
jgi:hypothetical protein